LLAVEANPAVDDFDFAAIRSFSDEYAFHLALVFR
jgi:hypothetical protein